MSSFKIIDNYKSDKNEDEWYTIHNSQLIEKVEKNSANIAEIEKKMLQFEKQVKDLTNENLRLVNRLLEAEIALERAKNSLVRKHIPFPFTPYISSFSSFQREIPVDDVKDEDKNDKNDKKDKKNVKL